MDEIFLSEKQEKSPALINSLLLVTVADRCGESCFAETRFDNSLRIFPSRGGKLLAKWLFIPLAVPA